MKRIVFVSLAAFALVSAGLSGAQEDKKSQKKEDTILNKTIGEWIKILREHDNPKYRVAALIALEYGSAAGRTALPAILDATEKDKDPKVRREAVLLIGRLGPETRGTMKALIAALQNDKEDTVREAAATAIGNKFTEQAADHVSVLADALKDPHPGTRIAVATALRNMGEGAKPAVAALIVTAKNRDEQALVRTVAIHIIGRQGKENPQSLPLLVELTLNEDNPLAVREAAIDGLGRSGSDAPDVLAALGKTLAAKEIDLRKDASVALNTLGIKAKNAWPQIKERLTSATADGKKPREPESSIRNHLIRLTGILGKEKADAISVLVNLAVNDESTENRIAAIQELGELRDLAREALPVLSDLAQHDARAAVRDAASKAAKQIKGV